MSTSTTTTTKNVKRTSKTREPSKERSKTKKDEAEIKTNRIKAVSKPKTTALATPTSNRLKNGAGIGAKLKKSEDPSGKSTIPSPSSRLKKAATDSTSRFKPAAKTTGASSTRSKEGSSSNRSTKAPSSSRLAEGNKLKISSRKPGSPINRATKSQFIPNTKQMYANALKTVAKDTKTVEEHNSEDSSACSTLERPRTATLRKGSIVNMNIAGPDVPKTTTKTVKKKTSPKDTSNSALKQAISDKSKAKLEDGVAESNTKTKIEIPQSETTTGEEYDYEEDFDSYASDFDEYQSTSETSNYTTNTSDNDEISTSSSTTSEELTKPRTNSAEEERKLDSGNFDLPETKHKPILGNITEQKEIAPGSLSDEGFEEIKSLQFVNFLGAKKKRELLRTQSKRNKRGEELLGMIRLDQRNFTLIDIPPVSYDTFIKSFGNRNSTQSATQTRDDDVSEETQTEITPQANKWTQFPIKYPKNITSMNPSGVGGDTAEENESKIPKYNEYNLTRFMRNSSQVILALLQETHQSTPDSSSDNVENTDVRGEPFCDGGVCLSTDFLAPRTVSCLSFTQGGLLKLASVHPPGKEVEGSVFGGGFRLKSVGCIWDPGDLTTPEDVFAGFGVVNAVCFAAMNNKLIFGGLKDGTLTLWDLLEENHTGADDDYLELDARNPLKRVRITTTPKCTTEPDLDNGIAEIVAVQSIVEKDCNDLNSSLQVLTLDEIGNLIIWGLITQDERKSASLVKYSAYSLGSAFPEFSDIQCTDLCIDRADSNHVYVTTNYGYTLHCLINGSKPNPKKYSPDAHSQANSIGGCHHQESCFLVGFEDGNVSLYSRSAEKPLATFGHRGEQETPVRMVEWSRYRPWIFYTSDSERTIHVWDLSYSEHFPAHSLPWEKGVKLMKLSEPTNMNSKRSYMAIIAKDESIHLHQLTREHSRKSAEEYQKELKVFANYINRL